MEEDTVQKLNLLISILVIIANSLQLLNQFINRKERLVFSLISIYSVNTALSNLIIGLASLLHTTIKKETTTDHPKIFYFHDILVRFSIVIKSLEIGVITTVRFIAVRKVDSYQKINRGTFTKIILVVWVTALALVLLPCYLFRVSMDKDYDNFFTLFLACIIFPLMCLSLILYIRTVYIICRHSRHHFLHSHYCNSEKCRNLSTAKQKLNKPFKKIDEDFESFNNNNNQHVLRDQSFVKRFQRIFETRTVKFVGYMVALHTVCWTPIAFYCIAKPNKEKPFKDDQISEVLISLGLAYSMLTPILFIFYLKLSFKKIFVQIDQQQYKYY